MPGMPRVWSGSHIVIGLARRGRSWLSHSSGAWAPRRTLNNFYCAYATARSRPLQLLFPSSPSHLNIYLSSCVSFLPSSPSQQHPSSSIARTICTDRSLLLQDRFSSCSTYLVLGSSATMGHEESVCRLKEYVDALEKECRKIEVFQRELPLCMQLVTRGN